MGTRASRILRIGIVIGGKIVQERLIRAGDPVTIGDAATSTFIFPETGLPAGTFAIFCPVPGGYELHFTDHMKGKVSSGGAVVALRQLRDEGSRRSRGHALRLTEQDRGKITMGGVTLLFQFVEPPPQNAVVPLRAMDFRPRLLEEDDPVFLGFLSVNAALASVLVVWVWNQPAPRPPTLEELPDRFVQLFHQPEAPEPEVEIEPEIEEKIEQKVEKKKVEKTEKKSVKEVDRKPKTAEEKALDRQRKRDKLRQGLSVLLIPSKGDGPGGRFDFGYMRTDDGFPTAVKNDGPIQVDISRGPKGKVGTEDEVPEGLDGGICDDGRCGVDEDFEAPDTIPDFVAEATDPEIDEFSPGGAAEIKKVVDANFYQVKGCYEQYLRADQNLGGRIEVEWYLANGRAKGVEVVENTSGNPDFANCIAKRITLWRFSPELDGDINYPFVFRRK